MEDRTIRPSMKTVHAAYVLAAIVFGAAIWAYYKYAQDEPRWLPAIALIVFLPPLKMHWQRRLITLRLHDDHLTLEAGFLSRSRRTVDMAGSNSTSSDTASNNRSSSSTSPSGRMSGSNAAPPTERAKISPSERTARRVGT